MARMKIFSTSEQNAYERPPTFNAIERKKYLAPCASLKELVEDLQTATNKVCFLITAGYFKARQRFFSRQFNQKDVEFVSKQLGLSIDEVKINTYSRATYLRHQGLILGYFGFSAFNTLAREYSANEIHEMVKVQFRPKIILLEIIQKLRRRKITLPTYNLLADMIVSAINTHQLDLNKTIKLNMTEAQKSRLDSLLEQELGVGSNDKWRYQITLLKKPSHSTRPAKIKSNITDMNYLLDIYKEIKSVVDHMALSHECLRYYAHSVIKSQVHQIARRSSQTRYLHLMAFIVYQTFKLQDMLIDTFVLAVQGTKNTVDKEHKEVYYREREGREKAITTLLSDLQTVFSDKISKIKAIINDSKLTTDQKILVIERIVEEQELTTITRAKDIETIQKGTDYHDLLESQSLKVLSHLLK